MDPQTPRDLGDIEESEPERRGPERPDQAKKSLDQFLAEFEQRLRDNPDEPATSAQAALEGRAQGVWRTPIEGGQRPNRRLVRRPAWRPDPERRREETAPPNIEPEPSPAPQPQTYRRGPETDSEPAASEPIAVDDPVDPAADAPSTAENVAAEAPVAQTKPRQPAAGSEEPPARRRHRHHRHRRK